MKKTWIAPMAFVMMLAGCGSAKDSASDSSSVGNETKIYSGDEKVSTYFYDFRITDSYVSDTYGDRQAKDGTQFLVVTMSVKNTDSETIPMSTSEFQAQWEDSSEDAYEIPLTDIEGDNLFPESYELKTGEERTGELVYQVPSEYTEYAIATADYFDDDTYGDFYFVDITPSKQ